MAARRGWACKAVRRGAALEVAPPAKVKGRVHGKHPCRAAHRGRARLQALTQPTGCTEKGAQHKQNKQVSYINLPSCDHCILLLKSTPL